MSLLLVVDRLASDDLDTTFVWYESQNVGLGNRFLSRIHDVFALIARMPEAYAVLRRGTRAAPVKKFPYVVLYRVETTQIRVIRVVHGRSNRKNWP